jgi:hypothetical protein
MRDQHGLAQARGDRRGGVADMDHERAAADRGAVDPAERWPTVPFGRLNHGIRHARAERRRWSCDLS